MSRVVIEHLTKTFLGPKGEPVTAVEDLSLTVEDKELLVLVGPSGCGKTTTLRLLAGLETPDSGTISIDGQIVNPLPPKERDVAMVFQHHALYPHLSAYENIALGLTLRRCPKPEIARRVGEAAEMLGLTDCLPRKPHELSGGQRQRVALGRAMVRRPKVFLFDEPLSNLDAPLRAQMRVELAKLQQRLGATMLYVTHEQVEAMLLGERVAVMNGGAIQQVAPPRELYASPANRFVAGFVGSPPTNFFSGQIVREGAGLQFRERAGGAAGFVLSLEARQAAKLESYAGQGVVLGLRPEDISERPGGPETPPAEAVEASVERFEAFGPDGYLHLRSAGHSFVARVPGNSQASRPPKVSVAFDLSRAHFFDAVTGRTVV